jgi:tRNA(adenine34) deaminase
MIGPVANLTSTKLEATSDDLHYMRHAIVQARLAARIPGMVPIGCVITRGGRVLAEGHNEVAIRHDPTAHAEIVALRRAALALDSADLQGATLYSTLQPCGMCSMAAIWSNIGRIVFGAGRDDVHRMYFEDRHLDAVDFIADAFRANLVLIGGVLAADCSALYYGPHDNPPLAEQGNI